MKVKWIGISTISLLLIGMGLSILGEAIILKNNDKSYFVMGTLALVIINSGLCILGEAIILKVQLIEKNLIKK
tara:strand:- start:858 stop:1076 length:219 start_codon:yes stop_codon:yes gene_type:complete